MNKIIIGVLANNQNGYDKMVQASRETCYLNKKEIGIEVFYLYGSGNGVDIPKNSYKIEGDKFFFDSKESYYNLLPKTIEFFEYCLKNKDFDFIFRTNCGSYIDLLAINKFCSNLNKKNTYCGVKGVKGNIKFASGSGFFISKDVAEKIVSNKSELYEFAKKEMDDTTIGHFLCNNIGMDITDGAIRKDITIKDNNIIMLNSIGISNSNIIDDRCYHYYFSHSYGLSHGPEFFHILNNYITKYDKSIL